MTQKEKKKKLIEKQIKLSISEKAPSLNRLNRARKMEKISPLTLFSVRAILSRVYIQLDTRLIEEGL